MRWRRELRSHEHGRADDDDDGTAGQCTVNGIAATATCTRPARRTPAAGPEANEICFCVFPARPTGFRRRLHRRQRRAMAPVTAWPRPRRLRRRPLPRRRPDLHDHDRMPTVLSTVACCPQGQTCCGTSCTNQVGATCNTQQPGHLRSRDHPVPEQLARLRPEPAAANGELQRPRRQLRRGGRRRLQLLRRRQPLRRLQQCVPVPQRHASLRLGHLCHRHLRPRVERLRRSVEQRLRGQHNDRLRALRRLR